MLESLLNLLCRHRKPTLLAGAAALVVGGILASRLSVNDSPERWLPASSVADWHRFAKHFAYADTVAVGLHFHREVCDDDLEFLQQVRRDLLEIEGINQVIDLSLVAEKIEGVPLSTILQPPADGENDPYGMYRGTLFDDPGSANPGGRTLLNFVLLKTETTEGLDERGRQAEIDAMRRGSVAGVYRVFDKHRRHDVTFHMAGGVVIQHELEGIAGRLLKTVLPLALLLTLLALGIGFRSISAVTLAVLGGMWSVVMMLAGVAIAGWTLNVITVGGPTLMVVIVIATTVHFSHYYSTHHHPSGTLPPDTMPPDSPARQRSERKHFVRWVAVPCLGAAIATGVGFLMLAFNELAPARELGIELYFGAVLAFFGAFLMWMLMPPLRAAPGRVLSSGRLRKLKHVLVGRPLVAVAIMFAILIAAGTQVRWVKIDADPFSFFQPESRVAQALDHFSQRKFGLYMVDVVLVPKNRPQEPGQRAESQKKDYEAARQFERRVSERAEVSKTISTLRVRSGGPRVDLSFDLPEMGKGILRRLVYLETFKDWTNDLAGEDALRVSFLVHDPGTGFGPLVEEVRQRLPKDRFECVCVGSAIHTVILSEGLVGGILRGLGVALVVMTVMCAVLFRSVWMAAIAFLPNAFPVLVVFGVMGYFGVPLNSGSAMVTTVALGIGLNDTVHFVMHYRRRRWEGADTDRALTDTFGEVGRPIVLTSVVNCLGFGIFLLSDFRPMYHFGLLAGIAMAAALVGDLVLLPNLLKLFDRGKPSFPRPVPPKT